MKYNKIEYIGDTYVLVGWLSFTAYQPLKVS